MCCSRARHVVGAQRQAVNTEGDATCFGTTNIVPDGIQRECDSDGYRVGIGRSGTSVGFHSVFRRSPARARISAGDRHDRRAPPLSLCPYAWGLHPIGGCSLLYPRVVGNKPIASWQPLRPHSTSRQAAPGSTSPLPRAMWMTIRWSAARALNDLPCGHCA